MLEVTAQTEQDTVQPGIATAADAVATTGPETTVPRMDITRRLLRMK